MAAALLFVVPSIGTSAPAPASVTIAGSLQSEVGCAGDWDPACPQTHLTYDASDDVWQGTFSLPPGDYEYKAALNDSWDENYGLNAQENGANIPLQLAAPTSVKFYYDNESHWVTDSVGSTIAVVAGDFQSELGCPGDWQPDCLRSWLEDPDGDGTYTFETTELPAGSYEGKVALNESWDVNYGEGGVPGGANISFSVPAPNTKVTFSWNSTTHVLAIDVPVVTGALSHFDLARKDCLGTARNTTSKVWYTVAGGVLSDVYYPTIDNTNVETLQYMVTDGSTFTDLQARDTTYSVEALPDSGGMACRVTTTAKSGKYTIETQFVTDPARNTVLMRVKLSPADAGYRLYVRFDPTVNGNGGGGTGNGGADSATVDTSAGHPVLVSSDTVTSTNAANRDYAQPVYAAVDGVLSEATSGLVGEPSDGLEQLDASHAIVDPSPDASDGNVVQTARIGLTDGVGVLALGFGATQGEAVATAEGSLGSSFEKTLAAYRKGWKDYDNGLVKPRAEKLPGIAGKDQKRLEDTYYLSANVLKASEDKTFAGAIVASLASPWGQAVSAGDPANTYFGSYREVFARDLYEAWTGLVADGDLATARAATLFLFQRQQLPDGSMPRNSLVNGKVAPDSFGTQLDETAYPIMMADQLGLTDATLYADHVKPAANFVAAHGPAFGVERWEEQSGYSPSTIAAEIAGLVAAADLARANGDTASASVWLGIADDWQRSVKGWTVTTNGALASRYFIRLSKTGDPNAAITYNVGNGGPTLDQRSVVDAGFLELVRLGALSASDPDVLASLPVVDATIRSTTPSGPGWHRYNGDGYGDRGEDGRPWAPSGVGTGHLWPALSAERGEQELATGKAAAAASLLQSMSRFASGVGLIPEQDWELPDLAASPYGTDPTVASIGFVDGGPAGSAVAAHVVGRLVRAARGGSRGREERRVADEHLRALRRPHPGDDAARRHRPDRRRLGRRLARDRDGDDRAGQHRLRLGDEHRPGFGDHDRTDDPGLERLVPGRRPRDRRHDRAQRRRGEPVGRNRPRGADRRVRLRAGHRAARRRRPDRRRQRPGQLRVPDVGQLPSRRLRPAALPGDRQRQQRRVPRPDPRPLAHVREPARRATRRRLRPRAGRDGHVHDRLVHAAQLRDRGVVRLEPARRGAGLRAALRRRGRCDARNRLDHGERNLAVHHVQRAEELPRISRTRVELHGRPHRPGRLQSGSGTQLRPDAAGLPVRRLRHAELGCSLHVRPESRSEGRGRDHAHRDRTGPGARLHARPRGPPGRRDPVAAARRRFVVPPATGARDRSRRSARRGASRGRPCGSVVLPTGEART